MHNEVSCPAASRSTLSDAARDTQHTVVVCQTAAAAAETVGVPDGAAMYPIYWSVLGTCKVVVNKGKKVFQMDPVPHHAELNQIVINGCLSSAVAQI